MPPAVVSVRGRPSLDSGERYDDLFRAHRPTVLRLCRLLLADPVEAEDAAQDVFLQLARQLASGDRPSAWRAWLIRVATNACQRRRRSWWRRWRASAEDPEEVLVASIDDTPEALAIGRERRRMVAGALAHLPPRQQGVFVLRLVEGWSTKEVAAMLGVSTGTVKLHLFRANRAFRKALSDAFPTPRRGARRRRVNRSSRA